MASSSHPSVLPPDAALRHAAVGCLLGTAVGDALGLAGEGLSKRRLACVYPDSTRYHLLFGRGLCSDDTEHACMTAQALLAASAVPRDHAARVFAGDLARRLRFWLLGLPAGVGLATGRAILKLWLGWSAETAGVYSAGNGPAMRAPIIGICAGDDSPYLRQLIRASTRITHTDPLAEQGALAVALAAQLATRANPPAALRVGEELATALAPEGRELAVLIRRAAQSVHQGESTPAFAAHIGCGQGVSGYMLHSVPVALHAWLSHPEEMQAALTAAIVCGGDTDSVAAIVGALVGARIGPDRFPAPLLDGLVEWPRTVQWLTLLGERLARTRTRQALAMREMRFGLRVMGIRSLGDELLQVPGDLHHQGLELAGSSRAGQQPTFSLIFWIAWVRLIR